MIGKVCVGISFAILLLPTFILIEAFASNDNDNEIPEGEIEAKYPRPDPLDNNNLKVETPEQKAKRLSQVISNCEVLMKRPNVDIGSIVLCMDILNQTEIIPGVSITDIEDRGEAN